MNQLLLIVYYGLSSISVFSNPQPPYDTDAIIQPILQMRKLKPEDGLTTLLKVTQVAKKGQSQE